MSLFDQTKAPLADRMRPRDLEGVVGQDHLVGPGQFIHELIIAGEPVSIILWGPPGSGKTTLARIIASSGDYAFEELSAVTSGLPEVRKVIEAAKQRRSLGQSTVLFVDEIHRFNKAQQDAFLPHVENGTIILLGATTENPSFEVISPLLSRSRVVTLNTLSVEDLETIIDSALRELPGVSIQPKAKHLLAEVAGGDARVALGGLEAAARMGAKVTPESVKQAMQKTSLRYDKGGEYHYNLISAYVKSMRGGAVDAALFYLARMLEAGEDPKFIARRMVIFAAEDVGLAAPSVLTLATATFQAIERIGMPEGRIILSETTIVLAKSPKNRDAYNAIAAAGRAVRDNPAAEPPLHLRNAPTDLMKDLGYGKGIKWEPGFEHPEGFMPEGLEDLRLYRPDRGGDQQKDGNTGKA